MVSEVPCAQGTLGILALGARHGDIVQIAKLNTLDGLEVHLRHRGTSPPPGRIPLSSASEGQRHATVMSAKASCLEYLEYADNWYDRANHVG